MKFSIIGLDRQSRKELVSHLSNLKRYEFVGYSEDSNKLLDIILSEIPDLIFINVDKYSTEDFKDIINIINDLYRSFPSKPRMVALASSKDKAYDCLKNNFYYYLLLPIDEKELRKLDAKLLTIFRSVENNPKKLCLKTYSDYRFIEIEDIIFLKADNNTTEFFMKDKSKIVAYKTLKYFESILPKSFRRIHQSFVINQNYISRIHLGKSECHLKPSKLKLPFSKSYRKVMSDLATNLSSNALT